MAEANNLGKRCQGLFFSRGEMWEAEFGHHQRGHLDFTQFRLAGEIQARTEQKGVVLTWKNQTLLAKPTSLLTAPDSSQE